MPLELKATEVDESSASPTPQYLYGVQGLRTVAALMVAVYHIWFHRVSGGVDIFFVVAGYFAAGSLAKLGGLDKPGQALAMVRDYWLRTWRRVIPSATVVISATALLSLFLLPTSQHRFASRNGVTSLAFVENWYLIRHRTNYLEQGLSASPFQQFWALSIQVQSYILFPLVALSAFLISRFLQKRFRAVLLGVSVVLFGSSLAFSIWLTAVNQPAAYFHLGARFWEFMAGVILALAISGRHLMSRHFRTAGWIALGTALLFASIADPSSSLPGVLALFPVLASATIIMSSRAGLEPSILRWKPIQKFADSSFSFYLWHWPLLVFYQLRYSETVSLAAGLGIILVSGVLAIATTYLIEKPIRYSKKLVDKPFATIVVGLTLMVMCAGTLGAWIATSQVHAARDWDRVDIVLRERGNTTSDIVPAPRIAAQDTSFIHRECVVDVNEHGVRHCSLGSPDAKKVVALVGASHEAQWTDVLLRLGENSDLRVETYLKSACPFQDPAATSGHGRISCIKWNAEVLDRLLVDPPDLVVTMATRAGENGEEILPGLESYSRSLTNAGVRVLGLRDNPRPSFNVPLCVELKGPEGCSFPRSAVLVGMDSLEIPSMEGFTFLDTADLYCPTPECPAVDDGVLMYKDGDHLTVTWTLLNGGYLHRAVSDALHSE